MSDLSHIIWTAKYRPKTVAECILPKTKEQFQGFVDKGELNHIFLHGGSGTGKTSGIKAMTDELGYETMIINGSNEGRLIDTLRGKVTQFAGTMSFDGSRKCLIIDECDFSNAESVQPALKAFIEQYEINCTFAFTCNFPNRVIDAIKSRCTTIDFTIPKDEIPELTKQMFVRATEILTLENIEYDKVTVGKIVKRNFPDFRKTLNELQRFSASGKIDSSALSVTDTDGIESLIKILRDKNFSEMRKWVATCPNQDISVISRKLYDKSNSFIVNENLPELIIHLADYSYKNAFVADAEINIVAMLTRILMDCEMK